MSSGLKSGLVLMVLGIICGTLLALVNSMTAWRIEAREELERDQALEVFYNLEDYDRTVLEDVTEDIETVWLLEQDGVLEAIVYQVSSTGYNGPVTMLIAVNNDYTIQGYTVISHSEDAGFGADIVDNDFNVNSITDISGFDAVAGATYTSDAIYSCFEIIFARAGSDFRGGLDD